VGQLFIDRVNKYGLVRLTGNRIYWLNLFRLTQGMPGAAQVIPLPSTPEEDIAFDTQGHVAAVHMSSGQVAMIDMMTGTLASIVAGVPRIRRQLRVHPFRQEFNYPWWDLGLGLGGEVTIDASPMRWSPPGLPMTNVVTLTPGVAPVEAQDFTPPPPIAAAMVTQQPYEFFDLAGVVHFAAPPGAFEPGATIHVVNTTKFQSPRQDDPNEDTAEFDGSAEFSVLAEDGDLICLQQFDVAGNGSPMSCLPVVLDVAGGGLPASFEFALAGPNPASGGAEFRLALPERQRVRVDIYDVSGRRLTTALDREFSAGVHPVSWDLLDSGANRVKAGVYFARVVAGPWQGDVRLVVVE
jgi:hypothetical protein